MEEVPGARGRGSPEEQRLIKEAHDKKQELIRYLTNMNLSLVDHFDMSALNNLFAEVKERCVAIMQEQKS